MLAAGFLDFTGIIGFCISRADAFLRLPLAYGTSTTVEPRSCNSISALLGPVEKRFLARSKMLCWDGVLWGSGRAEG
ncbi:hypothetical protein BDR04DRAFT_1107972 [Suillus decipiens]|nr:hypothetical protein BDR04DRAFT_1107972 [Suillus decipiens]